MMSDDSNGNESHTASAMLESVFHDAVHGDPKAQKELLEKYRYFIKRAIQAKRRTMGRSRDETVDLEQDVAMSILQQIPKKEWMGRKAFHGWLRKVITCEVIDNLRYHGAEKRDQGAEIQLEMPIGSIKSTPGAGVETAHVNRQEIAQLQRLLDQLPSSQALAVMLYHIGHSHKEIAEIVDSSPEAVRKLVSRGRAKLASLKVEEDKTSDDA